MLQVCGIPVAMANAFPEIKAVCAYETASNDEDGGGGGIGEDAGGDWITTKGADLRVLISVS